MMNPGLQHAERERRAPATVARWGRTAETLWRRTVGGALVFPPGATEPVALNETAADLWEQLEAPATLDTVVERLAERYGADADVVARDVHALLAELERLGAAEELR